MAVPAADRRGRRACRDCAAIPTTPRGAAGDHAEPLRRNHAEAVCQYDAFAGYCAEAEREGIEEYPLYAWTKATIEDPAKKAKYLRSFTLYVGGEQVYPKAVADAMRGRAAAHWSVQA